jgi:phage terminase large subunit-like protein
MGGLRWPAKLEDGEAVYLGLDLSSTTDLTALVAVSAENGSRIGAWFWKPEDLLVEHSNRDFGTGNHRYVEWKKQGLLETTPGRSVDKVAVALRIAELMQRFNVLALAYDRWRIEDLLREFDGAGVQAFKDGEKGDGLRLVPWGQGFKDMAPAIDALEASVINRELEQPGNQVLTWMMANAVATIDPAGNRKIDKGKARFRIDGAVALAMAIGLKARDRNQAVPFDVEALVA